MVYVQSVAEDTKIGVDKLQLDNKTRKINAWLSPADPSTNRNKAQAQCLQGSGQKFLSCEAFSAWKTKQKSFLWLCGATGCGKTVLSSTIIRNLEYVDGAAQQLLYFYFDFTDNHKQSLDNALRSLITQLYYKQEPSQRHLDKLWSSCQSGNQQPSTELLSRVLVEMLQEVKEIWIILDALDECQTRSSRHGPGLLQWIKSLYNDDFNIHLLAISRPEYDIKKEFEGWVKEEVIVLDDNLIADDIHKLITQRVRRHDGLSRWKEMPEVQEEIENTLLEKANGMYDYHILNFQNDY